MTKSLNLSGTLVDLLGAAVSGSGVATGSVSPPLSLGSDLSRASDALVGLLGGSVSTSGMAADPAPLRFSLALTGFSGT